MICPGVGATSGSVQDFVLRQLIGSAGEIARREQF